MAFSQKDFDKTQKILTELKSETHRMSCGVFENYNKLCGLFDVSLEDEEV